MKLVRFSGHLVAVVLLGALVFLPGPSASGQTALYPQPPGVNTGNFLPPGANHSPYQYGIRYLASGHDPETLKLVNEEAAAEREAAKLIREYGRSEKEGERGKIKTKLSEVLGKEFDLQQKRRDLELLRLEAQVKRLRDLMKKRNDDRQTIVEKRLDQLIREADGLGWTTPPGAGLPRLNEFIPSVTLPPADAARPAQR